MKNYTYDEYLQIVFEALDTLTNEEKEAVLSKISLYDLFSLMMTNEKDKESYIASLGSLILSYLNFCIILCKLIGVELPQNKTLVETYRELNADEKFDAALGLMNETDFQKDCSKILVNDFKKMTKSNPIANAIDKTLNLGEYFEKSIERGIGCSHKL